jgi:prefoldin alpha subunit
MAEIKEEQIKELQQSYMEMQAIDAQLKQGNQQLAVLDQQIAEIHTVSQSVAEIGAVKEGTDVFVPVANGIFAKARMVQSQELLVNVGASVVVPTPVEGVRKLLDQQAQRVAEAKLQVSKQMDELGKRAKKVEAKLKKLIA